MGCNCKNIINANTNDDELSYASKALIFAKKIMVVLLVICFSIILTPIIIVAVIYKLVFKGGGPIVIPKKIIDMLK